MQHKWGNGFRWPATRGCLEACAEEQAWTGLHTQTRCTRPATRTSLHMCTDPTSTATALQIVLPRMGSTGHCAAEVSFRPQLWA